MRNPAVRGVSVLTVGLAILIGISARSASAQRSSVKPEPGQLSIIRKGGVVGGLCPLQHTSVDAEVAGFGARVSVVQTFANPSDTPIEAIYTFPLPHDAAVDRMRIKVGKRIIEGVIKRREEAQKIYEAARNAGQTAALLNQERPNIFTQSVANIMPGDKVQVEISYVQVLKYENGQFEYTFPMVVGPRYLGNAPDPGKIAPPTIAEGLRTGSTIDLTVHLDSGAPIEALNSVLHKVIVNQDGDHRATISLVKKAEIPNRDFILRYQTATDKVQSAFLTSFDPNNGGFFDLILLPPKQPRAQDIAPREMIFVMDQSGSQSGFPIEKSKELTYKLLKTMHSGDTFNVYGFNTSVRSLWKTPQPYTPDNLAAAHQFLDVMVANGGTNLLEGLRAALTVPKDPQRLRVVLFNTDGYVGDEANILREIKKDRDQTRIFTFGIGNSVNRFLIDAMSLEGKGDSEMVTLVESASAAADRFVQRLRAPVLTDVQAKGVGIELTDMVPREIPDVFSDRPIVIQGRYGVPGKGQIVVSGRVGGKPWSRTLNLTFGAEAGESCVATLWARKKVDDLVDRSYEQQFFGMERNSVDFKSAIVDIALQFGIMTEYTSFVAVEPHIVNVGGVTRTVHVPVEMADGVSYKGVFGASEDMEVKQMSYGARAGSARFMAGRAYGGGGGFGGGPALMRGSNSSLGIYKDKMVLHSINRTSRSFEAIVDKRLRGAKGKIGVMIYLNKTDASVIAKIKALGVKVSEFDRKIGVVIGTCDSSLLKQLIAVLEVERIGPIE